MDSTSSSPTSTKSSADAFTIARSFIAQHEACKLWAYKDSVGVWTIGYGHTGPDVTRGARITQANADALLERDLHKAYDRLAAVAGRSVDKLSEHQLAALLSFVFNAGANPGWTIWQCLRRGDIDAVPAQLARFVYGTVDGKKAKIKGLVNRRAAEIALWHDDDGVDLQVASGTTAQLMTTPPAPADTRPASQSKSVVTAGAAFVATGSAAVGEVSKTLSPFAEQSDTIRNVVATITVIAAGLAVLALFFAWLKKKEANQ